jgi:CxxC motif-containing protein
MMGMEGTRSFTCIVCPNGCRLQVEEKQGEIRVTGNQCKRGIAFAEAEVTNPTRTVTSTIRTVFPQVPVVPVRIRGEIPRDKIGEVMAFLNTVILREPLGIGAVAVENILGLGRDLILTSNVLAEALFNGWSGGSGPPGGGAGAEPLPLKPPPHIGGEV